MAFTDSGVQSATSAPLIGSWLHDVTDPAGTLTQYLYNTGDRTEKLTVDGTAVDTLGRSYPIIEFGIAEENSIDLNFQVPYDTFDDPTALVQDFRNMVEAHNTVVYRDNRGRLIYGSITNVKITDEKFGYSVAFTVEANNYLEELQ